MNEGRWQVVAKEAEVTTDIHGNPITNSLGEPFSPPITKTVAEWTFIEANQ